MFSSAIANLLQYFSFPAELIGIFLAYIEIRHPDLANRFSERIVNYARKNAEVSLSDAVPVLHVLGIVTVFVFIGIATVIFNPPDWVIYGPLAVLITLTLAMFIAAYWIPKRALGTIGLMIAGIGMLIECYQVVVLVNIK